MAKSIHFVGIGGIGMSALARMAKANGMLVSGSDIKQSKITSQLIAEGITVYFTHEKKHVESVDEVIFSTAIQKNNPEFVYAKETNKFRHRSDLLADFFNEKQGIAIAGTHGKTSTTTMMSHLLLELNSKPSCIVGGIVKRMNSNSCVGDGKWFVAEADESDKSFLKLKPYCSIITNIESDHLDQYENLDEIKNSFKEFLELKANHNILCIDDPLTCEIAQNYPAAITYGFNEMATFQIVKIKNCGASTDVVIKHNEAMKFTLPFFWEA
jgi:UDP-N-acetylmuramate--alanine ligase